jgi:hypothetical protein
MVVGKMIVAVDGLKHPGDKAKPFFPRRSSPIWTAKMTIVMTESTVREAMMTGKSPLRVVFEPNLVRNNAGSVSNGDTSGAIGLAFDWNVPNPYCTEE